LATDHDHDETFTQKVIHPMSKFTPKRIITINAIYFAIIVVTSD